ncbi:bacterial proteasome activator family protein [Nocardioides sp. Y6]|uniref:Bacterial proteasome activator n=1 Tax=Nocardioides malaquae TaxID=2773426 RepID=A0ABR9RRD5_9ACTN|nr:bacterial proteasome activator family protein [Nocardioides malaquae]MBE7324132.1 bacterial proteasome activator family protein [Nocardioides malaquae]
MTQLPSETPQQPDAETAAPSDEVVTEVQVEVPEGHVLVIGPDGEPVGTVPAAVVEQAREDAGDEGDTQVTDLVEQPAKVMRIGSMIKQLLEEVKAAPLDEASRARLRDIHQASIKELESGLAPELIEELERIALPFTDDATPSEGELRIAQAQLVGWLEGLFHGIQTAIYAQQMVSRAQLEQMRRALPGMTQAPQQGHPGVQDAAEPQAPGGQDHQGSGGMYL